MKGLPPPPLGDTSAQSHADRASKSFDGVKIQNGMGGQKTLLPPPLVATNGFRPPPPIVSHVSAYEPKASSAEEESESQSSVMTSNYPQTTLVAGPAPLPQSREYLNREILATLPVTDPLEKVGKYLGSIKANSLSSISHPSETSYPLYQSKKSKYQGNSRNKGSRLRCNKPSDFDLYVTGASAMLKTSLSKLIDGILITILILINVLFYLATEGMQIIHGYVCRVVRYQRKIRDKMVIFKLAPLWLPKFRQIFFKSNKPWKKKFKSLVRFYKTRSIKLIDIKEMHGPAPPPSSFFKDKTIAHSSCKSSTSTTISHHLLRHYKKEKNIMGCKDSKQMELPIKLNGKLPCLLGNVGQFHISFLLDSGSFHSLIPEKFVSEFKEEFFDPPKFQHGISLQAHNKSTVQLRDYGVILPVDFTSTSGLKHSFQLPFLIELDPTSQPIIGFQDILHIGVCPFHDLTVAQLKVSKKYKAAGHILPVSQLTDLADGDVLIDPNVACETCQIPHVNTINCAVAKNLFHSRRQRNEFIAMLGYDPIIDPLPTQEVFISKIVDGALQDEVNAHTDLVEVSHVPVFPPVLDREDNQTPPATKGIDVVPPTPLVHAPEHGNMSEVHPDNDWIKGESLCHSKVGLHPTLLQPLSLKNLPINNFKADFERCLSLSHPKLSKFLTKLFECFDHTYSRNKYDMGAFLNPNFSLNLEFKEGCDLQSLPKDKPFPIPLFYKKACDRILQMWEDCKIVRPSTIKTHASRLIVTKKHLNPSQFDRIQKFLAEKNIQISEESQLYKVDPDHLEDAMVNQLYRICIDGRGLNNVVQPLCPLMQNPQHTIFDLINSLGPNIDSFNPDSLKIRSKEDLRPPPSPPLPPFLGEKWEPPPTPPLYCKIYMKLSKRTQS